MAKCGTCRSDFKRGEKNIQCSGLCEKYYHLSCSKLDENEFNIIKKNAQILWFCDHCHEQVDYKWRAWITSLEDKMKEDSVRHWKILSEINNSVKEVLTSTAMEKVETKKTYASILGKPNDSVIVVQPKNEVQKCDKTRTEIKKNIDPTKVPVNGLRNVSRGGVVITCKDKEATEKVKEEIKQKLGETSYIIRVPEPRMPRIKVIGMSEMMANEKLTETIKIQNDILSKEVKLKVLYTGRMARSNKYFSVIEIDGPNFRKIMKEERINIGWDRCRVFESFKLIRCFKCSGFNHMAAECRNEVSCPKCGGKHKMTECKEEKPQCTNCRYACEKLKMKLDINHGAYDLDCPVYKRKIDQERTKINYITV